MAKPKAQARRGRPPFEINTEQLKQLGAIHATIEEIAAILGCAKRTLINKMKDPEILQAYEDGKHTGRLNLRRLQWRHAQGLDQAGNPVHGSPSAAVNMTIHMSKQPHWLDEGDKPSQFSNTVHTVNAMAVNLEGSGARERLTVKLSALYERIESRVVELAAESGASLVPSQPIARRD